MMQTVSVVPSELDLPAPNSVSNTPEFANCTQPVCDDAITDGFSSSDEAVVSNDLFPPEEVTYEVLGGLDDYMTYYGCVLIWENYLSGQAGIESYHNDVLVAHLGVDIAEQLVSYVVEQSTLNLTPQTEEDLIRTVKMAYRLTYKRLSQNKNIGQDECQWAQSLGKCVDETLPIVLRTPHPIERVQTSYLQGSGVGIVAGIQQMTADLSCEYITQIEVGLWYLSEFMSGIRTKPMDTEQNQLETVMDWYGMTELTAARCAVQEVAFTIGDALDHKTDWEHRYNTPPVIASHMKGVAKP